MNYQQIYIKNKQGINLHTHVWIPSVEPEKVCIIMHGMMEHGACYNDLARVMVKQNILVIAHDMQSKGRLYKDTLGVLGTHSNWNSLVDDIHSVYTYIKTHYSRLPITLLGHSMGSFLAQQFCITYKPELQQLILSGSAKEPQLNTLIGRLVAKTLGRLKGINSPGTLLHTLIFGGYNKNFSPNRTDYDWLSQQDSIVDIYIRDPLCGQICSYGFFYQLFTGIHHLYTSKNISQFPKTIPVLFISGKKDPMFKTIPDLVQTYKQLGIPFKTAFFDGCRHAVLCEKNDKIIKTLLKYI